ncbi:MAG TPA: ABC transporter ATP-binding protein [Bryobacteraceae bacterium]|nr:ABC transporter ATP-binding protein [Bryobacteraceae bacterium]
MEVSAVEVRNLSKNYSLSRSQLGRLRHLFSPGVIGADEGLWALRDVSFSVMRGEAFGIIGANGSGKSTLLQIIAGILRPTSGSFEVRGRLSALLELGSGFSPEFTGRDNVYLNASLLGLSRDEIDGRFDDIERFAEIGSFINQPIRTYSTGMVLRLAFAVVAHVDPDVLIVDEALAVGDIAFRQRCMRRIHELRASGVTILFVSHETSDVKALCERCLWLQNGVVQEIGDADTVVGKYLSATLQREISHAPAPHPSLPAASFETALHGIRYGDARAKILGAALIGLGSEQLCILKPHDRVSVRMRFRVDAPIESAIAGFLLRNAKGENIFGSNTARENYPLPPMAAGEAHTIDFHWTAPELAAGAYSVSLAIADGNQEHFTMCDYVEDAIVVRCEAGDRPVRGYFQLRCTSVAIHQV